MKELVDSSSSHKKERTENDDRSVARLALRVTYAEEN